MKRFQPRLREPSSSPEAQKLVSQLSATARFAFLLAIVVATLAASAMLVPGTSAYDAMQSGTLLTWSGPGSWVTILPLAMAGIGVVLVVVGAFVAMPAAKRGPLVAIGVVAITFGSLAFIVVALQGGGPGDPCIANPALPQCLSPGAQWETLLVNPAAAHDAAGEYPSGTYTLCNAAPATPVSTAAVVNTNMFIDNQNKKVRHEITMDDDIVTTTATFSAPDCGIFDFQQRLTNGQDRNGDGVIDAQNYFGQVLSITRTTTIDGNNSNANNVFYSETDDGFYVGWFTDGSNWVSAYPGLETQTTLTTGPSPVVNLGSNAGGAADAPGFWYIMRNYGPFGYTQPPIGTSIIITGQIGSPGAWRAFTVEIALLVRT